MMRLIYVDEAGTSNPEPVSVVCAVIVNADTQWMRLARLLEKIKDRHVPSEFRPGFILHAKNIIAGGKVFPIDRFNLDHRLGIIAETAYLHMTYDVPLCVGYAHRTPELEGMKTKDKLRMEYLMAYSLSIGVASRFLKTYCPNELAMVIAEDNEQMRNVIKHTNAYLRNDAFINLMPQELQSLFPIDQIVGLVHFSGKREDPLLQLADACAFSIRRYAANQQGGEKLFQTAVGRKGAKGRFDPQTTRLGAFGSWPEVDLPDNFYS